MNTIENIDWSILLFINSGHTLFFDSFFIIISNKYTWIPLYLLLGFIFLKKLGVRNGLFLIVGGLLCIAFTDLISSKIIKILTERIRPCHTIIGQTSLWLPNGCGGIFGFVSNHAANTMGIAVFSIFVFTKKIKGKLAIPLSIFLLIYAFLNGLSRIYLGKHYPTDVICGAILGMIGGFLIFYSLNKWFIKDLKK